MHFSTMQKIAFCSLVCASVPAISAEFNFEGSGSQLMEASITRAGSVYYESSVGFNRDSNFNLQHSAQPGWMLSATAIGNLVNVQMSGSGNSVIVNAMQVNRGNQTAIVSIGAHNVQSTNSAPETANTTANTQTPSREAVQYTASRQNTVKN